MSEEQPIQTPIDQTLEDHLVAQLKLTLKECPFCGSLANLRQSKILANHNMPSWFAECAARECAIGTQAHTTPVEAVASWNRRV